MIRWPEQFRLRSGNNTRQSSPPEYMRTAGMIGGLGPESSIYYYRSIGARYRAGKPDNGYPHLVINSLDVDRAIALVDGGRLSDLADYLWGGGKVVGGAGASFG